MKNLFKIIIFIIFPASIFLFFKENGQRDVSCPHNHILATYKPSELDMNLEPNVEEFISYITEELSENCAKKLVGISIETDSLLLRAGFPTLVTKVPQEIIIDDLILIADIGNYFYFTKDKNIIKYLEDIIKKEPYNEDKLKNTHDYALASLHSSANKTISINNANYKSSYSSILFAIYLPIWENKKQKDDFIKLCNEINCNFDKYTSCNKQDALSIKKEFIINKGDLLKTLNNCKMDIVKKNNSTTAMRENITNLRKIGILDSRCKENYFYYILNHGFKNNICSKKEFDTF